MQVRRIQDGVTQKLNAMISRQAKLDAWLNRVAFPLYKRAQKERYASENHGAQFDGNGWDPLNDAYAERKLRLYRSYDGGGRKMMIATGRMKSAVIGENTDYFRKLIERGSLRIYLIIGEETRYFNYADDARTVSSWSSSFYRDIAKKAASYMGRGDE